MPELPTRLVGQTVKVEMLLPVRRRPAAYRNDKFHIRREAILEALGLPDKIPVGLTGEWRDVRVRTGRWLPRMGDDHPCKKESGEVVLPRVVLAAEGVANRVRVECPECRAVVRFCALQQHVGSVVCRKGAELAAVAMAVVALEEVLARRRAGVPFNEET